jgi:hypothetical protein
MARERKRTPRAARPTLDGAAPSSPLETRRLLSAASARRAAIQQKRDQVRAERLELRSVKTSQFNTAHNVKIGVANGGKAAVITDTDGEVYVIRVSGSGFVRARAVRGGLVDIDLFSTNNKTVVTIDPQAPLQVDGTAHQFQPGAARQDDLLHVRDVTVANGRIAQILGYKTADVSGAITVMGAAPSAAPTVTRIAFFSLLPGASVQTRGDLNTLTIFNDITLDTGPGIRIGRDLNWLLVGADITLTNGASIIAARDIGLAPQGPKGSAIGGQGGLIQGDLIVGAGSTLAVGRFVDAPIVVQGSLVGNSNLPSNVQAATIVFGTRT